MDHKSFRNFLTFIRKLSGLLKKISQRSYIFLKKKIEKGLPGLLIPVSLDILQKVEVMLLSDAHHANFCLALTIHSCFEGLNVSVKFLETNLI